MDTMQVIAFTRSGSQSVFELLLEVGLKGTSHDSIFQISLFSTLADIFAV